MDIEILSGTRDSKADGWEPAMHKRVESLEQTDLTKTLKKAPYIKTLPSISLTRHKTKVWLNNIHNTFSHLTPWDSRTNRDWLY